jgi:peptidoglycan/xylan/chitin deacetylase (PgdA/CDA1 family)
MPSETDQPLYVAVTADVDPDANRPVRGRSDAASAGHPGGEARFDGCLEGLRALVEVLGEMSLPATLFWEARTLQALARLDAGLVERTAGADSFEHGCHGFRHEDFAGKQTGLRLSRDEARAVLERAGAVLHSVLGVHPRAFRAPYCRLTEELADGLVELEYLYDASITRDPDPEWGLRPYVLRKEPEMWELALCRGRDGRGRPISTYLWQLFEGNRPVADYVDLIARLRGRCPGGLVQIALHPWHLIVGENGVPLAGRGLCSPVCSLRHLLQEVRELDGVAFTTAGTYLETVRRDQARG